MSKILWIFAVLVAYLAGVAVSSLWLKAERKIEAPSKPRPPAYEYRCDHARVVEFTTQCVKDVGTAGYYQGENGLAVDCRTAATYLFCESRQDGHGDGHVWEFKNKQWHMVLEE